MWCRFVVVLFGEQLFYVGLPCEKHMHVVSVGSFVVGPSPGLGHLLHN